MESSPCTCSAPARFYARLTQVEPFWTSRVGQLQGSEVSVGKQTQQVMHNETYGKWGDGDVGGQQTKNKTQR